MKRILILATILALVLTVFVACGPANETTEDEKQTIDESTTAAVTEEKPLVEGALTSSERAALEAMVAENIERAKVMGASTVSKYGVKIRGYYNVSRYYNPKSNMKSDTASVWHYTAYYAMVSRLVDIAEGQKKDEYNALSNDVFKGFEMYSGTGNIITYLGTFERTLYGVNRGQKAGGSNIEGDQMVYDDQMWIIREMVYRYKQTGDVTYLNEATRLSDILIQGWDFSMDKDGNEYGGIPWGPFYSNKHTCSNAPFIAPLVELYEIKKELGEPYADYYLNWATKIYDYCKKNLRLGSGLYADSTGCNRTYQNNKYVTIGKTGFDGTTYSYNTGAMISGAALLYRATEDKVYLNDAKTSARAAFSGFCKTSGGVPYYPNHTETVWFNLVLMQGFLDLYEFESELCEKYIMSFQNSYSYAYENYLENGMLPRSFVNGWDMNNSFDSRSNVMDQASATQVFAMLAMWAQDRLDADDALLAANGIK